ncbi:VWA domain-containing protein [Modicisalibacter coralii]|uniref:VWA domain-containing protein n=1 Tax=Modicisalibacter coralii TaxID=2304602 RepID=UPI00100A29E4|nr:VWA domain-containing protein [Halomonas coralii]
MSETPEAAQESVRRWRLALGRFAESQLSASMGGGPCLTGLDARRDHALDHVYGRAYRRRGLTLDLEAGRRRGQKRSAGLDPTQMTLPDWLGEMRELFPKSVREDVQGHALTDFGMTDILSDPTALEEIEPRPDLLAAMLSLRHRADPAVASLLRAVAQRVVEELLERLKTQTLPALTGARMRVATTERKGSARDIAWDRTIRANLRNYDPERGKLIVDKVRFYERRRRGIPWEVVLCVDQSGSMAPSLIHAAVMGAIFARLPGLSVRFVAFDTSVVDLSDHVGDPVELLLSVQLGGGTNIGKAIAYCENRLIRNPARTLFILVSDFHEGASPGPLIAAIRRMASARIRLLGVAALDETGRADFDRAMAGRLADAGMPVSALTPDRLAEWVAEQIR